MHRDEPPSDPIDEELDALLVECLEHIERRDTGALEALLERHSGHALALRRQLGHLESLGMLEESIPEPPPGNLGDFELLEVLGQGGMGVVYRARQTSLQREVALKLIRNDAELPLARTRERFDREIRAATRLSHPNIVQVFLATAEGSCPFFAMELIEGASLADLLRVLEPGPEGVHGRHLRAAAASRLGDTASEWNEAFFDRTWEEVVVDLMVQVTEGIVHAHERGVWHRDLKPSNVMLTPSGHVKVLDFGLARLRGATRMTVTGSPLGSLPYLAPEVLRGRADDLTGAIDVYSLGVLMYELLTLRLPHWDESPERLVVLIVDGTPTPPDRIDPSLSGSTTDVCLRAMESDPADRYHGPSELLDDLRALQSGEPVCVRRAGKWRRARRWLRRHTEGSLAAVVLATVLIALGLWSLREPPAFTEQGQGARQSALEAVREVLALSEDSLRYVPQSGQRAQLASAETAAGLWKGFYESDPHDSDVRRVWARLCRHRGSCLASVGRSAEALLQFEEAAVIFREEQVSDPGDLGMQESLARTLFELSGQRRILSPRPSGRAEAEESLALFDGLAAASPDRESAVHNALTARSYLFRFHDGTDPSLDVEELTGPSVERARGAYEHWPGSAQILDSAPRTLREAAFLQLAHGRPDRARALCEEALSWIDALGPERPARVREVECLLLSTAADAAFALRLEAAGSLLDRCIELQRELAESFPLWSVQRRNLAVYLAERARWAFERADPQAGWDDSHEAIELISALCREHPEVRDYRVHHGQFRNNHARSLLDSDPQEAARWSQEVLDELDPPALAASDPDQLDTATHGVCIVGRGLSLIDALDEAEEILGEWSSALQSGTAWHRRLLADAWNEWVLAVRGSESLDEADRELREQGGVQRMFELLESAVDAGYRDRAELDSTESLDGFRQDPRFLELLLRLSPRQ